MSRAATLLALLNGCSSAEPPPKAPMEPVPVAHDSAQPLEPLSADEVLFSLRGRREDVSGCFARSDAASRGLTRLRWVVDESGRVQEPRVEESTLAGSEVNDCLQALVTTLHFTEQPGPQEATWTFVRGLGDDAVLERAAKRERQAARSPKRRAPAEKGRGDGVSLDKSSPGKLDIADIENVAEHGFRLYAFCMREGLTRNIELTGRVLLNFTIDRNGRVANVSDAGSDLGDLSVIDCVAEAFYAMQFPEPEGGVARFRYSILLNDGE